MLVIGRCDSGALSDVLRRGGRHGVELSGLGRGHRDLFVCNALHRSSDGAIRRNLVVAHFEADGNRYLVFVAQVNDESFLRGLGGGRGSLDAFFCAVAYRAMFSMWFEASGCFFG